MYIDLSDHNDAAQLAMRRLDRQVTQAWRFRHLKGKASRSLVTILTSMLAFFF
jgi:hypothetical protein